MRVNTFADADARNLLDALKLEEFKINDSDTDSLKRALTGDIHRRFHYVVCRWLQDQGASVIR